MRSARRWLALLLALAYVPTAVAQELPADLAMVPGDSLGFVHLRVADIWKHDLMKSWRDVYLNAGPKAIAAFEKQVYPLPSSIERASIVLLPPSEEREPPTVVGIVRFSVAVDPAKLVKLHLPKAETIGTGGQKIMVDKELNIAIHFKDDKHMLVGEPGQLAAFLKRPPVLRGAITPAVDAAAKGMAVVASINMKAIPIPPRELQMVPENIQPILKAERITLTMDLKEASPLTSLRANYAGEKLATEAEEAVKDAIKIAKVSLSQFRQQMERQIFEKENDGPRPAKEIPELVGALAGLGMLNSLNTYLDNPPLKREGNDLAMTFTLPKELNQIGGLYPAGVAVGVGLLLPAVQKVREAAARTNSSNNLKQIGLAMHNYHDVHGQMPGNIYDKNGKALLSWRVAILPYIEQQALYQQFKLDEPWDSEHNKKLLNIMPKPYILTNARNPEVGKTFYQGFECAKGTQPRSFFVDDAKARTRLLDITDGTSNTVMVVEAADAVEWTKPADLAFDPKKPLPKLGGHSANGFNALFGDGSVRFLTSTINQKTLLALITISGGEVVDLP